MSASSHRPSTQRTLTPQTLTPQIPALQNTALKTTALQTADVLGEMFHSLSQPLTSLRCSLELSLQLPAGLSIEKVAEHHQQSVALALQQTERVIALVESIREYLDASRTIP
jgi:hypothetical protein